jgi:hypothetical protein
LCDGVVGDSELKDRKDDDGVDERKEESSEI